MAFKKTSFGKSKNDKMKWFLIIGGILAAGYYFFFNTTTGQAALASAKNATAIGGAKTV